MGGKKDGSLEWPKEMTIKFVEELKKKKSLWDTNLAGYKDRGKRKRDIQDLSVIFKMPSSKVEKKIKVLKTQFTKESKKPRKSLWYGYDLLKFLQDREKPLENLKRSKPSIEKEKNKQYDILDETPKKSSEMTRRQLQCKEKFQNPKSHSKKLRKCRRKNLKDLNRKESASILNKKNKKYDTFDKTLQETSEATEKQLCRGKFQKYKKENMKNLKTREPVSVVEEKNGECDTLDEISDDATEKQLCKEKNQNSKSNFEKLMKYKRKKLKVECDEHAIFGKFISNELKRITNPYLFTVTKHKIQECLFEAQMSMFTSEKDTNQCMCTSLENFVSPTASVSSI